MQRRKQKCALREVVVVQFAIVKTCSRARVLGAGGLRALPLTLPLLSYEGLLVPTQGAVMPRLLLRCVDLS